MYVHLFTLNCKIERVVQKLCKTVDYKKKKQKHIIKGGKNMFIKFNKPGWQQWAAFQSNCQCICLAACGCTSVVVLYIFAFACVVRDSWLQFLTCSIAEKRFILSII